MNKHKHFQQIRAFADGWAIEFLDAVKGWVQISNPSFVASCEYRVIPDAEGWLPWYGGECPVSKAQKVKVKFKDGSAGERLSSSVGWSDHNLIAYKLVEEPKQKVKMCQWVVAVPEGTPYAYVTSLFYKSEDDLLRDCPDIKIIQRADWTEIEVEES